MRVNIVPGARFHAVQVAEALCESGYDVSIYSSSPRKKLLSSKGSKYSIHFIPLVASIIQYKFQFNTRSYSEIEMKLFDSLASVRMRPHDILHGWAFYCLNSAIKTKRNGGKFILERSCPHILFQQNLLLNEAEKLKVSYKGHTNDWIQRSIAEYDMADSIIVPSNYTYQTFLNHGYEPEKIRIVRLNKNTTEMPEPKSVFKSRQSFVVGVVGGNLLRKGYYYLLKAWQKLALPNAKLLLKISSKELKSSPIITKLLADMNNVEIVEYVKDINDFYRRCDIFCLPSIDDGFGMAVVEAMSNSLPVIITTNVGSSDLIEGHSAGFVIPTKNSEKIMEKIAFFYENRLEIFRMGQNAYTLAAQMDSKRFHAEDINRLYSSLL